MRHDKPKVKLVLRYSRNAPGSEEFKTFEMSSVSSVSSLVKYLQVLLMYHILGFETLIVFHLLKKDILNGNVLTSIYICIPFKNLLKVISCVLYYKYAKPEERLNYYW